MNAVPTAPAPQNEPVLTYAPGSPERALLRAELERMAGRREEIPVIVGGREYRTGRTADAAMPHDHAHVLATWHAAGDPEIGLALDSAREAQREWASWPWEERAAVFLRAADLLAGPWRHVLNAATILGQSKSVHQAEIDSACELIDFLRFNVHFAEQIYTQQPISPPGVWNRLDHRPLEGFVYAATPFNFTAIAGNLPTAPAVLGNVCIWKPSANAMLSGYWTMRLLEAAGLPPGVVSFLPGDAAAITERMIGSRELAGIHFTGSTSVFQSIWRQVGERIDTYRSYPRLVGETGGKDFIVAHASADVEALAVAVVRGGFEYQGQKCSAASRIFVPDSLWPRLRERIQEITAQLTVGDPADFGTFMGAVIDARAFAKIRDYVEDAKQSSGTTVIAGGGCDDRRGYFVEPTVIEVTDTGHRLLCEEVFGPVVSVYVYPEARWEETLKLVDAGSPYALTGAVFADDRRALQEANRALRNAAGNYYVNDKPTGAVVGQQPFGGSRASGTNDKAGSILNLLRWTSPRTIKETLAPAHDWRYPHLDGD